jgi:hypothetical protein
VPRTAAPQYIVVSSLVLVTAAGLCLTAVALLVDLQPLRIGSMNVTIRNPARPFFVAVVAAALLAYIRPGAIGGIGDGAVRLMSHVA